MMAEGFVLQLLIERRYNCTVVNQGRKDRLSLAPQVQQSVHPVSITKTCLGVNIFG